MYGTKTWWLAGAVFPMVALLVACDLPDATWQIVLTDGDGRIEILTVSARELFRNTESPSVVERPETLSSCLSARLEPSSGLLATVERHHRTTAIRVYDRSRKLTAERTPGPEVELREMSCPAFLGDHRRIFFIDTDGSVTVGQLRRNGEMATEKVCETSLRGGDYRSTIACVDDHTIALDQNGYTYCVDLRSRTCRKLGGYDLLGTHAGELVVTRHGIDVPIKRFPPGARLYLMDMEGAVRPWAGRRTRMSLREWIYAGLTVHRLSPDGEYWAYDSALPGRKEPVLVFQHIRSGRRVCVNRPRGTQAMGSWRLLPPLPTREGHCLPKGRGDQAEWETEGLTRSSAGSHMRSQAGVPGKDDG